MQKGLSKPPSPHIPIQALRCEVRAATTTETAGGMHRQYERRALQTSDAAGRSQEGASCKALCRHEDDERWSDVLRKDFDVSETSICYPLKIARCPCDLLHVTAESLILPAQPGGRSAWQILTSQKSIHGRSTQALQRLSVAEARACYRSPPSLLVNLCHSLLVPE